MKLTKNQQEFIGTTFNTPKGGTLKVTGLKGISDRRVALFWVECSVCSLDKELFPDRFYSNKSNLEMGKVPCGCSNNYQWTDQQDKTFIQRLLDKTQPNLKVVNSNGLKGNKKRFTLECTYCSRDSELWPRGSITSGKYSLQQGQIPCGCSVVHPWTTVQDEIVTQRILDEKMPHLKVISSSSVKGRPRKFTLECNTCSEDKELWPLGVLLVLRVH